MPATDHDARRTAWSTYWAAGRLHSCAGTFADNYEGAIGDFWRARSDALPDGARVLDLATGNGALPRLLWERRGPRGLHIDAVDLARVAPRWYDPARHVGVHFHSGVAMERLPFPDAAFDLVASQYGFEYADRAPALAEALRVAAPDGRLALVMHHAGSVLVQVGREELAHQRRLLAGDGLLAAAAAVAPWFAMARAGRNPSLEPGADRDRAAYNAAMRALSTAIAASPAPDLLVEARDHVQRLLAGTGAEAAPTLASLHAFREALVQAGLRTGEMIDCALDEAAVAALVDAIRAARPAWTVRGDPLRQREGVLGWALVAGPAG